MLQVVVVDSLKVVEGEPLAVVPVLRVATIAHVGVATLRNLTAYFFFVNFLETSHVIFAEMLSSLNTSKFPKMKYIIYV